MIREKQLELAKELTIAVVAAAGQSIQHGTHDEIISTVGTQALDLFDKFVKKVKELDI